MFRCVRVGFCLVKWAKTLYLLQGKDVGGQGGEEGMGNGGKKAGGDGKRGGEPWEENREGEGDKRAREREGNGPH